MNTKFEFTGETKDVLGVTLRRIKAVESFGSVSKGEVGGWIEKEENLNQSASLRVSSSFKNAGAHTWWCTSINGRLASAGRAAFLEVVAHEGKTVAAVAASKPVKKPRRGWQWLQVLPVVCCIVRSRTVE